MFWHGTRHILILYIQWSFRPLRLNPVSRRGNSGMKILTRNSTFYNVAMMYRDLSEPVRLEIMKIRLRISPN